MMFEENYHDVEIQKKKKKNFFFKLHFLPLNIYFEYSYARSFIARKYNKKRYIYTSSLKDTYLNTKNLKSNYENNFFIKIYGNSLFFIRIFLYCEESVETAAKLEAEAGSEIWQISRRDTTF